MKKNLPIEFNYNSQNVRTLKVNNQPWFVTKDVCDVLGYSETSNILLKLDEDEKLTRKIFVSGQEREMWTVNESGLYGLILRSNKPEARQFRKWITSEVIPNLRKHGTYSTGANRRQLQPAHETFERMYEIRIWCWQYPSGMRYEPKNSQWATINDLIAARNILDSMIRNF